MECIGPKSMYGVESRTVAVRAQCVYTHSLPQISTFGALL
jgi:hypothetical protein